MDTNSTNPVTPPPTNEGTTPPPTNGGTTPPPPQTPAAPASQTPSPEQAPASSTTPPVTQPLPAQGQNQAKNPSSAAGGGRSVPLFLIISLLIVSFLGGLFLAAWYFQNQLQKTKNVEKAVTVAQTPSTQRIIVATDATFQPMEYLNKQGGLIGYDIDLGYRLANDWGVKIEFRNIPWDDLFKSLDEKKVDMIMSGVTINDERKMKYDFSDPYLNAGQVAITRREYELIHSSSDLSGKRIAVQKDTTNEKTAQTYTSPTLVLTYPDFEAATKALVEGKADAILSDLPAAKGIITANPTLKIATDPFTNENYGIVFRKGDPNVKKVNEILTSLKVKGILTDLKQKWLN